MNLPEGTEPLETVPVGGPKTGTGTEDLPWTDGQGQAIVYFDDDGAPLCAACASICNNDYKDTPWIAWKPKRWIRIWQARVTCDGCGRAIKRRRVK